MSCHAQAASGVRPTHNLELDCLAIKLDRSDLEIHTDRGDVTLCVRVVCEPQQEA
jgi:hypothetical protein